MKIIRYLYLKGLSPSQIKYICIKLLKLDKKKIIKKISKFIQVEWIEKAKTRFWKEKMHIELKELGLI